MRVPCLTCPVKHWERRTQATLFGRQRVTLPRRSGTMRRMKTAFPACIGAQTGAQSLMANVLEVALGSLVIALLAQVAIPIGPVPVSGQTLGVMAVAVALGPRRGPAAVLLYLAKGAAGLPAFAGGTAGFAVLFGPTGGYLVGFVAAAWVIGLIVRGPSWLSPAPAALGLAMGTAVIYLCGAAWLSRFIGWSRVLEVGVLPFLVGDALKIGIVAVAARRLAR